MASSIKGIIVEIGGDTSGLQKALSKVNSATSSLSKELRGVNSLLKLDPKNTELLSQKQEVLSESIEKTENKLRLLHSTYQRAVEAEVDGAKISESNWRNLQREIINTQNKLKDLQLEASNWNKTGKKIEDFGIKIQNLGNRVDILGTKLSKVFTSSILTMGVISTKSAVDFETAFTGVEKTVDGTAEQMHELEEGIKKLAKEIPSTTTEIAGVAEAAGQLGIKTEDVLSFTKVMIDLGNATNLTADEAATALAKFANITNMSAKDYDKLGSTIVALGNNFATTEADIVAMATRLAATGELAGLSQPQILSLATAMSSVGIEAEAGGSAMSKLLKQMQVAVETGNTDLKNFSKVANMSTKQFKKAFEKDAVGALSSFISGLNDTKRNGKSAISILQDMELTEVRLSNTILSLSNANEVMNNAVNLGNKAWEENSALTNEAQKRYGTLESRFKKTLNKTNNLAINLGQKLTPAVNKILDKVDIFIDKLDKLTEEEAENVIKTGLMIAAAGPLVKVLGKTTTAIGTTVKGVGLFTQAIGVMKTGAESSSKSVNNIAKVLSALSNPATLAAAGVTAAIGLIVYQVQQSEKQVQQSLANVGQGASDFINGIDTATSHLSTFNSELFASSEEQEKLQKNMDEVQKGITQICKTASDERRGYTQEEITQLDEYFKRLRELNQREIEIQQSIAGAITQQATNNAEAFEGSLNEYKQLSQDWLKTAEEQKNKTIELINKQTIEEIALLNQRYGKEADMQNEAYAKEFNKITENKQTKIDLANSEMAEIASIYAEGYLERAKQNNDFYAKFSEYNKKVEKENIRHNGTIESINENGLLTQYNKNKSKEDENYRHQVTIKKIWKQMYKDMDESQEEQLGVWLAQVAQTELYGGKLDEETKEVVDLIIDSYDSMPSKTKETMKETMEGMIKGMEDKEASLFAKATGIANGILSRLRKTFDIHSPSRETEDIFEDVMAGSEKGIENEKNKLYKQIDNISQGLLMKFNALKSNIGLGTMNQSVIDSTKTIFTTPQIVFNIQELDDAKLQQCFNYINRKFGSAY